MSARRAKLAAVHAAPAPRRYAIRPEAMYPANEHNQAAYAAAVAYLRDRTPSIFTLDPDARRPAWCARPTNQENDR